MTTIDYFIAALIFAVSAGICFGLWIGSVAAGIWCGLVIMFVGAMVDFATSPRR